MSRFQRINFIQGGYYHIYNRGNRKQNMFLDSKDYQRYLQRLQEYKDKHNISILAYCLMPNHVHLLLRQNGPEPISTFIQRLHTAYSMYFNKNHEETGHIFEDRFKAKLVDKDEYLIHLSRYIHLNPAKFVKKLTSYKWSSYPAYIAKDVNETVDMDFILSYFKRKKDNISDAMESYRYFVKQSEDESYKIDHLLLDKKP